MPMLEFTQISWENKTLGRALDPRANGAWLIKEAGEGTSPLLSLEVVTEILLKVTLGI